MMLCQAVQLDAAGFVPDGLLTVLHIGMITGSCD